MTLVRTWPLVTTLLDGDYHKASLLTLYCTSTILGHPSDSFTFVEMVDLLKPIESYQVDILIFKSQALQLLYLKHHDNVYKT